MSEFSNLSDQELVAFLKLGNHVAYAELYNRYKNQLYLHAYRMLHNDEEAKDVVQDMFAAIWLKKDTLIIPSAVDAYLYGAIRNRILNFIAHQKVISKYTDSITHFVETERSETDENYREKELIAIIEKEIALLPPKMREVFELSRNKELSYKQIAEQLGISDKTVKKQINKAIKVLRHKINLSLFFMPFI